MCVMVLVRVTEVLVLPFLCHWYVEGEGVPISGLSLYPYGFGQLDSVA